MGHPAFLLVRCDPCQGGRVWQDEGEVVALRRCSITALVSTTDSSYSPPRTGAKAPHHLGNSRGWSVSSVDRHHPSRLRPSVSLAPAPQQDKPAPTLRCMGARASSLPTWLQRLPPRQASPFFETRREHWRWRSGSHPPTSCCRLTQRCLQSQADVPRPRRHIGGAGERVC